MPPLPVVMRCTSCRLLVSWKARVEDREADRSSEGWTGEKRRAESEALWL